MLLITSKEIEVITKYLYNNSIDLDVIKMKNKKGQTILFAIIIVLLVIIGVLSVKLISNNKNSTPIVKDNKQETGFARFSSKQDFISKIVESQNTGSISGGSLNGASNSFGAAKSMAITTGVDEAIPQSNTQESTHTQRFSETNVQVTGIDEPDIVKTDGKRIFYSSGRSYWWYYNHVSGTEFINVSLSNLNVDKRLNISGDLLLSGNDLIILSSRNDKIEGYNKNNGSKLWELKLNNSYLEASRMYNNKLYVILRSYPPTSKRQPIMPLMNVYISPRYIYYPRGCDMSLDSIYSIFEINPDTGAIEKNLSFISSGWSTTVYMSKNNIYIALYYRKSNYILLKRYFLNNPNDLPSSLISRMKEIDSYDISDSSKLNEVQIAVEKYLLSLDEDDQMTFMQNLQNYVKQHEKELDMTRIAKISVNNLELKKSTNLNGKLLNQYSMDEYNNYLRIAMTRGNWDESDNILYILNDNLNVVGKTENFGTTESIYAVRFIGNKGYVVTYRNTDPLFIMDLTNVKNPQIIGELKIEGYSSYLHPIDDNLLLGIGRENGNVKVSLFDVSNPKEPKEISKFLLDEYWSDAQINPHAFLIDKKHKIFFIPSYDAGYIFSYDNNKLKLVKSVKETYLRRALYINDYLYLIGDSKLVVLDENNWKRVKELDLFES